MPLPDCLLRVLRALPEAAMVTSTAGLICAANKSAREALRLPSTEPVQLDLMQLAGESGKSLAETLRRWSRSADSTPGAFSLTIDGAPRTFNARGFLVLPPSEKEGGLLFVSFSLRDQTTPFLLLNQQIAALNAQVRRRIEVEEALRRSEVALRERAREAEALNRMKDEFLATLSHELRTPLNAILGWTAVLQARTSETEIRKVLGIIDRNAQTQAKLIEDVLDVSRIVAGKLALETKPADLVAIVEAAIDVLRPSSTAKQIEIEFARPEEHCLLVADPDRLQQVVWNLLSNAVKFSAARTRVRVEVQRLRSRLTLTVSDNGNGIEPSFLPFVFERFKQADGSTTRRFGGLGLGLALARHIVELHGGTINAFSKGVGQGATFTVELPVRALVSPEGFPKQGAAVSADRAASEKQRAAPALLGVRVVVVDDEADARDLLMELLSGAGAQVTTTASVTAGLEAVRRLRPHVLVSDIGMPEEDGYSLVQRLRRLGAEDGGGTPTIALTAYARPQDRTKALAAGFTTHISKPVNSTDLMIAVANLAALSQR